MRDRMKEILEQTRNFVKKELELDSSGHDWWHIVRVTRTAKMLAMLEGADEYICELSALLHDVADEKLNESKEAGMDKVKSWLHFTGVDPKDQDHILGIIAEMSFGSGSGKPPVTLEGRIVQDADRLDAIGAIGIARTFAYSGWKGQLMYDPALKPRDQFTKEEYRNERSTAVNHFYEKLLKLKSRMNTQAARVFAEGRHEELKRFLWAFDREWGFANESSLEESVGQRGVVSRIHVAFDASSSGSLKLMLREKPDEHVVSLEDNLMIGPLPDDQDPGSTAMRWYWFLGQMETSEERDDFKEMLMKAAIDWRILPCQLATYPLVVWASESAAEQTGLRRLMASLPEDADVSVINATNALNSEAVQYSHTGEITHEKLASLLGTEKPLSREEKKNLAEDWHRLVAEQGTLRIMENGEVQTVPEDTFDRSIIEAALELGAYKGKFLKSARIIGQVIGYGEQQVSDFFIEYRVKQLIKQEVFAFEGELSAMRMYSISLTEMGRKRAQASVSDSVSTDPEIAGMIQNIAKSHFEFKAVLDEIREFMSSDRSYDAQDDNELYEDIQQAASLYEQQFTQQAAILEKLTKTVR